MKQHKLQAYYCAAALYEIHDVSPHSGPHYNSCQYAFRKSALMKYYVALSQLSRLIESTQPC